MKLFKIAINSDEINFEKKALNTDEVRVHFWSSGFHDAIFPGHVALEITNEDYYISFYPKKTTSYFLPTVACCKVKNYDITRHEEMNYRHAFAVIRGLNTAPLHQMIDAFKQSVQDGHIRWNLLTLEGSETLQNCSGIVSKLLIISNFNAVLKGYRPLDIDTKLYCRLFRLDRYFAKLQAVELAKISTIVWPSLLATGAAGYTYFFVIGLPIVLVYTFHENDYGMAYRGITNWLCCCFNAERADPEGFHHCRLGTYLAFVGGAMGSGLGIELAALLWQCVLPFNVSTFGHQILTGCILFFSVVGSLLTIATTTSLGAMLFGGIGESIIRCFSGSQYFIRPNTVFEAAKIAELISYVDEKLFKDVKFDRLAQYNVPTGLAALSLFIGKIFTENNHYLLMIMGISLLLGTQLLVSLRSDIEKGMKNNEKKDAWNERLFDTLAMQLEYEALAEQGMEAPHLLADINGQKIILQSELNEKFTPDAAVYAFIRPMYDALFSASPLLIENLELLAAIKPNYITHHLQREKSRSFFDEYNSSTRFSPLFTGFTSIAVNLFLGLVIIPRLRDHDITQGSLTEAAFLMAAALLSFLVCYAIAVGIPRCRQRFFSGNPVSSLSVPLNAQYENNDDEENNGNRLNNI